MRFVRYGTQLGCRLCGADIEYHGAKHGWIDRGGNHFCDTSGHHPVDENGATGEYPHVKHRPYPEPIAMRSVNASRATR